MFDPEAERPPEEIDPRLLSVYEIDVLALCRALRRANQLAGPPVAELSDLAYFIGHRGHGRRRRSVCLGRLLHDDTVLDVIWNLRARIGIGALVLLTPGVVELRRPDARTSGGGSCSVFFHSSRRLTERRRIHSRWAPRCWLGQSRVRDRMLRAANRYRQRIATLDGREVILAPQEFAVLSRLAEAKRATRTVTSAGTIFWTIVEAYRTQSGDRRPGRRISTTRSADCVALWPQPPAFPRLR